MMYWRPTNHPWQSRQIHRPNHHAVRRPKLLAYGYVFDQTDVVKRFGLTYDALVLPNFDGARSTVSEISKVTGVSFDQVVLDAEQVIA
jgi:hypothetical protein